MRRPLYHRLDALWSAARMPAVARFSVRRAAGVTILRMARSYFGVELPAVHCYAVGDTMVDTGLPGHGHAVLGFARDAGVQRALLTHYHEDHAGNAARLGREGVDVLAGELTARLVAHDLPLPFYEHFLWGKAEPAQAGALDEEEEVSVGPHRARVIPAPGHCPDQIAFHVPAEGWLFSGDAFIHERVKLFRSDEDFAATVATLERFLTLDFDMLFCAHRPQLAGGKDAIRRKLGWLRDIEGRVRGLHAQGLPVRAIARRVLPRAHWLTLLALGDVSAEKMVRSILHGPKERPEVVRAAA